MLFLECNSWLTAQCLSNAYSLICDLNMECLLIYYRVYRHTWDAHFMWCANHPNNDFTPVCNEDLLVVTCIAQGSATSFWLTNCANNMSEDIGLTPTQKVASCTLDNFGWPFKQVAQSIIMEILWIIATWSGHSSWGLRDYKTINQALCKHNSIQSIKLYADRVQSNQSRSVHTHFNTINQVLCR